MFISCRVLCFHSPYHKTRVICLTCDKSAYHHQSNVPLNQLCAPRHDGRDGKKRGPGLDRHAPEGLPLKRVLKTKHTENT